MLNIKLLYRFEDTVHRDTLSEARAAIPERLGARGIRYRRRLSPGDRQV